jgi:hypothetical protein
MASKILKALAFAAGLGLTVGLGSGKWGRGKNPGGRRPPGDGSLPEPVLKRLDRIESRLSAVETQPPASTEQDVRIERQAQDIEMLQVLVSEHRQKVAAEVANIDKRFADITEGIPAVLESIVCPHVDDFRVHLLSELQQSVNVTLTKFERAIDDKVSDRISTLEKAMLDQSTVVTALSRRAIESDMNLQRLISAVERLCERSSQSPAQPFESAFRPRILKEEDNEKQFRHRVPMTQL